MWLMQPTFARTTKARKQLNNMEKEFKLLSEDMSLLYEGIIHGTRLEKEDIDVNKNTYLEIMGKVKYISFPDPKGNDRLCYSRPFSNYLEDSMTHGEKDIIIVPQIIDKEGNKIAWEKWEKRMSRGKQYYVEE